MTLDVAQRILKYIKSTSNKSKKINKLAFVKINNFCASKDTVNKVK